MGSISPADVVSAPSVDDIVVFDSDAVEDAVADADGVNVADVGEGASDMDDDVDAVDAVGASAASRDLFFARSDFSVDMASTVRFFAFGLITEPRMK